MIQAVRRKWAKCVHEESCIESKPTHTIPLLPLLNLAFNEFDHMILLRVPYKCNQNEILNGPDSQQMLNKFSSALEEANALNLVTMSLGSHDVRAFMFLP